MISFTARLKALAGKEAEATEHLKTMVKSVNKHEPGAMAYICHASPDHPGEFLFYEVYADKDAYEAHGATPHFENLKRLFGEVLDPDFGVKIEKLEQVAGFIRG